MATPAARFTTSLEEVRTCLEKLVRFTDDLTEDEYLIESDQADMRREACVGLFIRTGEACTRALHQFDKVNFPMLTGEQVKLVHRELLLLKNQRNMLTHQYERIIHSKIYSVIKDNVPASQTLFATPDLRAIDSE